MPSFYRAKGRTHRLIVASKADLINRARSDSKGEFLNEEFGIFDNIPQELEEEISPNILAMLRNGKGTIKKCVKCNWYEAVPRKTVAKLRTYWIRRFGGYTCKTCNPNTKFKNHINSKHAREIQKVYKRAYEKNLEERSRGDAFNGKTYTRQMTPEERKQYGLD